MSKDGGPAFPCPISQDRREGGIYMYPEQGMSLRDWYAGMVLQGIVTYIGIHDVGGLLEQAPARAYELADAMLRARGQ